MILRLPMTMCTNITVTNFNRHAVPGLWLEHINCWSVGTKSILMHSQCTIFHWHWHLVSYNNALFGLLQFFYITLYRHTYNKWYCTDDNVCDDGYNVTCMQLVENLVELEAGGQQSSAHFHNSNPWDTNKCTGRTQKILESRTLWGSNSDLETTYCMQGQGSTNTSLHTTVSTTGCI